MQNIAQLGNQQLVPSRWEGQESGEHTVLNLEILTILLEVSLIKESNSEQLGVWAEVQAVNNNLLQY